jgi:glyoxylase-like metal-dependent hydrolase (beta-lactamase superfamily II)
MSTTRSLSRATNCASSSRAAPIVPIRRLYYVPSIGLIVAGDVVYNQCRMYVGDTTPESRKNWIAALDRLAALNPAMVVAGHKKPGAPDSPSTIQDTKRYLQDFDRLQKTATSDQELFDQMTELYPHWVANQSWLMFGFPGA